MFTLVIKLSAKILPDAFRLDILSLPPSSESFIMLGGIVTSSTAPSIYSPADISLVAL